MTIPLPGVLGLENPLDLRGWLPYQSRATANHYPLAAAAARKKGGGGDDGGDDGGAVSAAAAAAIAAKLTRKSMLLGKVKHRARWQRKTWPRKASRKSTNGSSASSDRNTSV